MKRWFPYIVLIIVFVFLFSGNLDAQCSQCKLLATQSENAIDDKILDHKGGNNINVAILYIMMTPYILLGIAAVILRKRIKRLFNVLLLRDNPSDSEV